MKPSNTHIYKIYKMQNKFKKKELYMYKLCIHTLREEQHYVNRSFLSAALYECLQTP